MKVRYSRGINSEAAQIHIDAATAQIWGTYVSATYDEPSRTVYLHPSENGSQGWTLGPSYHPGFVRCQPRDGNLPRCAVVEIDAAIAGDVLSFTIPEALPQATSHPRKPKAATLTPQGIVEAFQAAMANHPGIKLKVLAPGHGLLTIHPAVIKVSA